MDHLMFHVLSIKRAKLCLILVIEDVKTASYQFLLEEKMIPNAGRHFDLNFLFVYNNVLDDRA